jgi:hypothetical protein
MNFFRASTSIVLVGSLAVAGLAYAQDVPLKNWSAPNYFRAHDTSAASGETAGGGGQTSRQPREALSLGAAKPLAVSSPATLSFIAMTPCRLVDTRGNGAPLTGGSLPAATVRSYTLSGVCGLPANAKAVSLNATVVKAAGPGFLTLWPQGGTFPSVSTLNYVGGDVVVNAAVVPLSASGGISMALGVSGGDVILDTNGYYAAGASGGFTSSANGLTGYPLDPFVSPSGPVTPEAENLNTIIVPTACTADFQVVVDAATGGATPITFTLRQNGVDTSVSCTLPTSGTSCASSTGAALNAGDRVTLHLTGPVDYGAANTLWVGLRCQ